VCRCGAKLASLTTGMRLVVIGAVLFALAGCGGEEPAKRAATPAATATPAPAKEVVYLYRVQGDDPLPDSITLRADGTAAVIRGGGHGGFRSEQVELGDAVAARATRLAEHAPWKALDGSTVTPGGFGGWDNDMRYMLRRGQRSVTVSDADMPRRIRPLIHMLDAIIENDKGRIVSSDLHSGLIPSAGVDAAEGP
jgi:hypothetical protein